MARNADGVAKMHALLARIKDVDNRRDLEELLFSKKKDLDDKVMS